MHTEKLSHEMKVRPFIEYEHEAIIVVCAADNNYAMQLAVTIRSILENFKGNRKIIFFVIDGGITNRNKQRIRKSIIFDRCEFEFEFVSISDALLRDIQEIHELTETVNVKTKADYISIASFYRVIIPELLSNQFEKVIYLDCDLVVKGNLEELWKIDIGENYLLAAQDTWIPSVSSPTAMLNFLELGLEPKAKYFNAGVLVINLKKWREDRLNAKAVKYFRQNLEHIGWYDQGLLNALLINQWGQLDPRWNFNATSFYSYSLRGYVSWKNSESLFSEDVYNNLLQDPYIVHFVSAKKPWTSRHTPCKEEFFKYLDMTVWSGWRLTIWRRLWNRFIYETKLVLNKTCHSGSV
jgi:lipopolysaccharide biosynthesis glycosyltransferase